MPSVITKHDLAWGARTEVSEVLRELKSSDRGLSSNEAKLRLQEYGHNEVASANKPGLWARFLNDLKDPLSLLLMVLGIISYFTGDIKATVLITVMMVLSVSLRFFQELKADTAAEKLKALVHTTATVIRGGIKHEVPLKLVVPGDVVELSAGDMVPADVRLLVSRDLFVNQAALTGESLPVEKHVPVMQSAPVSQFELQNICFMGTGVESGTATAVVVYTGRATFFGSLAASVIEQTEVSSFDKGVKRFTWLMIRFIGVMVPLVFLINGFTKNDWLQAFLFALAVAVGLTPELLPMIVTVNLSRGAFDMSKRKVIVKRLNSIQNVGAMDILCTDKTGTLTKGKVALIKHLDITGNESQAVLDYAFLNSVFQTGLKNLLDDAVMNSGVGRKKELLHEYQKIDEIPFDFKRRRLSVVVSRNQKEHTLVCKGAVEEVMQCCQRVMIQGKSMLLTAKHHNEAESIIKNLGQEGFRLVAVAIHQHEPERHVYTAKDEEGLTLVGFLAFLDPPKETAAGAIQELERYGIRIKVLTGDNTLVANYVCSQVNLSVERGVTGSEIDVMSDEQLVVAAEEATVFSKLEPRHKQRVIKALQSRGHVVGFLGDGINDAPALKTADVGISVDSAADIAKESSDIILLERSLLVLKEGVREGRKVFGNIVKYIQMAASSNFGNMFSVVGASLFLPFLPMLPLQVIANNLLYDVSQVTIPTDTIDEEYLEKPRQWHIDKIKRFILFMGPVSSIFDYVTYGLMLFVFNAWTNPAFFHTGWFVESLLTQTLIIHIIRTRKIPFFQSRASTPLIVSTLLIVAVGLWLPYSPLAGALGFVALPAAFWGWLGGILICYFVLAGFVKRWFTARYDFD